MYNISMALLQYYCRSTCAPKQVTLVNCQQLKSFVLMLVSSYCVYVNEC